MELDMEEHGSPEVLTKNARSVAAAKRWEKEREKKQTRERRMSPQFVEGWMPMAQYLILLATVLGGFIYVHTENNRLCDRLDKHIGESAKQFADASKRTDELHKEFYDLLKEMKRQERI